MSDWVSFFDMNRLYNLFSIIIALFSNQIAAEVDVVTEDDPDPLSDEIDDSYFTNRHELFRRTDMPRSRYGQRPMRSSESENGIDIIQLNDLKDIRGEKYNNFRVRRSYYYINTRIVDAQSLWSTHSNAYSKAPVFIGKILAC
jgi:hypothetical protein